jgi:hypothetical protein
LDAAQGFVHIHGLQQGLVVAGLELVSADQEAEGILLDAARDLAAGEAIEGGLAHRVSAEVVLTREGHDRQERAAPFRQNCAKSTEILHRPLDAACHHDGAGLALHLPQWQHVVEKVIHHDLGLVADGCVVAFHIAPQLAAGVFAVEQRISLDRFCQPVVTADRHVVLQHIQDELFLDRLLHHVHMKWPSTDLALIIGRQGCAKEFQGLRLGRGGEGEIAGIGEQLAAANALLDHLVHKVFHVSVFVLALAAVGERLVQSGGSLAALAGVGFVDDHRIAPSRRCVIELAAEFGEGLQGADDDLLAGL